MEGCAPKEAFISHLDQRPTSLEGGGDGGGQAGSAHAVVGGDL